MEINNQYMEAIKKIKIPQNPFVLFAPFLLLYIALVLIFPTDGLYGDENRYLIYARNIFDGSQPKGVLHFDYLGDGPGYSLLLLPFIALHVPLIFVTLLNALFYYFSVLLLFKTLLRFTSFSRSLIFSVFWACYYNLYEYLIIIYTETFCAFLICLLIYSLVNVFQKENLKKYIYLSGFIFGYLALTKPIFGYVLLCMLFVSGVLWLINKKAINYRKVAIILLVAFATTLPYLVYTHSLTGKMFYWSSFGGNNLYWMSTPSEDEYGDWFRDLTPGKDTIIENNNIRGYEEYLKSNHQKDFEEINKYQYWERDDAYKRIAINNIKAHPVKFIQNCFYNAGRILFNYPYSYTLQKPATLLRLPLNGIIVLLMLFCILPTFINWKNIDFSIRFLLFFTLLYLGGSVLGSAETRMFAVIVPVLLVWIAFITQKTINVNFHNWASK